MIKKPAYLAIAVLVMGALQACSEKTVNAPAAPMAAPARVSASAAVSAPAPAKAVVAEPVEPAPQPMLKTANTVCADRKIVVEANCLDLYGPENLACTSQSIKVYEDGSGKLVGTKTFAAVKGDGSDPATVEEKIGELTCVTAKSGEKYIVTNMYNGGNCEECEWHELYSWDGAYLGSDRDRKVKNKALTAALAAINEEDVDNTAGSLNMESFYSGSKAD
jgi:hypothetical protein